jgi:RNA polymerase sigma-70 factor, ECF subfamily
MSMMLATDPALRRQSPKVDDQGVAMREEFVVADGSSVPKSPASVPAAAFHAMYQEHFKAVWLTLKRFGVWDRDLEDAAHDVFMVAHRRWADFDSSRPMRPWLKGIACFVASDFRRRAQHRREVVDDGEIAAARSQGTSGHTPAMGVRADARHEQREERDGVLAVLSSMDFDQRAVLVLHDIEGHSMPEVAIALSTNVNTLYSRLRHARVAFKELWLARQSSTTPAKGDAGGSL